MELRENSVASVKILGSGREVGRAAILVESRERGLLLDYGVSFDKNDLPVFPGHVRPRDLEGVILSHSHLDHIGAAPYLFSSIKPKVIGTGLTLEVSRILLYDMVKLNGDHLPYDRQAVDEMISSSIRAGYGEEYELGDFRVELLYSGHIPGSASVLVEIGDRRVLYTSDVNRIETKLVFPAKLDGVEADILVIESTYGATNHPDRRDTENLFMESVREVVESGGIVLVPSFSVSRGQEILSLLAEHDFDYPVWIDGMIREVTDLYLKYKDQVALPGLLAKARSEFIYVRGWQDRKRALRQPGVIVASAGMLKGGPSLYYLKRIAHNERNAIFMVSYQAPGTPGREILEAGEVADQDVKVKARVQWFDFSSHIDQKGILELIKNIKGLSKVVLVHGTPKGQEILEGKIREEIGLEVLSPENGSSIEI